MSDYIPTAKFAESLGVKADTVRRRLCVTGSYFGARPVKPPNGRLLWSKDDRDRLRRGEVLNREQ